MWLCTSLLVISIEGGEGGSSIILIQSIVRCFEYSVCVDVKMSRLSRENWRDLCGAKPAIRPTDKMVCWVDGRPEHHTGSGCPNSVGAQNLGPRDRPVASPDHWQPQEEPSGLYSPQPRAKYFDNPSTQPFVV